MNSLVVDGVRVSVGPFERRRRLKRRRKRKRKAAAAAALGALSAEARARPQTHLFGLGSHCNPASKEQPFHFIRRLYSVGAVCANFHSSTCSLARSRRLARVARRRRAERIRPLGRIRERRSRSRNAFECDARREMGLLLASDLLLAPKRTNETQSERSWRFGSKDPRELYKEIGRAQRPPEVARAAVGSSDLGARMRSASSAPLADWSARVSFESRRRFSSSD